MATIESSFARLRAPIARAALGARASATLGREGAAAGAMAAVRESSAATTLNTCCGRTAAAARVGEMESAPNVPQITNAELSERRMRMIKARRLPRARCNDNAAA